MRVLNRKIVRDVVRLRGQLVAVAVVVCCGVATFVAMRASYGALLETRSQYYAEYHFASVFAHVTRAPRQLVDRLERIPGVRRVEGRVVADVTLDVPGLAEPATGRVVSIPTTRAPELNCVFLRRGCFPERSDPDAVVASEAFAEANGLRPGDRIGAVLNGRWRRLRVCGIGLSPEYVYEIRGFASMLPDNRRFGVLWMGEESIASVFDLEGAFNDVTLALEPGTDERTVIEAVDHELDRYGCSGAFGREDQVSARFLDDEIRHQRASGLLTPAVFLAVAAFLLHLVMVRLVGTQREQIAVLKAFGYSNGAIGLHYIKLALVAVGTGALAGVPLGLWLGRLLAELHAQYYRFPVLMFGTNGTEIAVGVIITAGAACLGAFSAVLSAVRLAPAEAMRPAAPGAFRPLVLERVNLHRMLTPAVRMMLRNLERRPVRTLLSILGIAVAVAIVVLGRSMYDAVDYISKVQFEDVQRDDVTVAFVEPRSGSVRHDLEHLPGVVAVEPFRVVGVELIHDHRRKRTTLLGLAPTCRLRRIVSVDRVPVSLPRDGLLLTTRLADMLGLRAGHEVDLQLLEGDRRRATVLVAGVVDEPMGLGAYMEASALARLLGEQDAVSGAYLEIDAAAEGALFRALKGAPSVAGVSLRRAALASFQTTIEENMAVSNGTIFLFAIVIAAAVVYNGARIAFSERQHELATLRVLGFTFQEVTAVLFGEQILVTALAMPVGFALGWFMAAWLKVSIRSDMMRLPLGTEPSAFAIALLVVASATVFSGLAIRRKVVGLPMVEALKVRE